MNVRTLALAAIMLLAAPVVSFAQKSVGYDIGACAPGSFMAAHIELTDETLSIISVSPGPDRVIKLPEPLVYKYSGKEVLDGQEVRDYVSSTGVQIGVFVENKNLIGKMSSPKGEVVALVYGVPDQDGSKLAETAKEEFGICRDVFPPDNPTLSKS